MSAVREAGPASFHEMDHWHAIDWQVVEQHVRGLQVRIAKAVKDGNWRKVNADSDASRTVIPT